MEKLFRWAGVGVFVAVAGGGLFVVESHASQPALIVLDTSRAISATATKATGTLVPAGWELKVKAGQADIAGLSDPNDEAALRFRSARSSFALERALDVDPNQTPYLNWKWKVTQLPKGGDFRHSSTDDQAAQVMVAFADNRILAYIWDSTAPQGLMESASSIPLVHIFAIVCRSGLNDVNRWLQEIRNVAADYQKAYGKPAPHVKGLRLQINSQHTGSSAESYFGEVEFRNTQS